MTRHHDQAQSNTKADALEVASAMNSGDTNGAYIKLLDAVRHIDDKRVQNDRNQPATNQDLQRLVADVTRTQFELHQGGRPQNIQLHERTEKDANGNYFRAFSIDNFTGNAQTAGWQQGNTLFRIPHDMHSRFVEPQRQAVPYFSQATKPQKTSQWECEIGKWCNNGASAGGDGGGGGGGGGGR